jgi:Spy/CpxP family protein refolding chaperone
LDYPLINERIQPKTKKGEKTMGKRKNYLVVGGAALLIMFFAGFGLVAGCGPCRGFHRGFHPGFHNKDFSEHILRRLDKRVETLNLSETQKEKYKEIKGKLETRLKEHMDERKRWMEKIQTEMKKGEPDVKALSESLKKRIERFSGFMEGNLDLFVEFYQNLDKEQKEKIMATVREKMKRWWIE